MSYNQISKYISFSQKVFSYLNGEINKVNKNVIFHVYPHSVGMLGEMKQRSTLTLYIYDIIERCNNIENVIKNNILFTIVHELYHADQELSPFEYNNNPEYAKMVENTVNYMTVLYIKTNKDQLEREFDMNIMVANLNYYIQSMMMENDNSIRYKRVSLFNFYNGILSYLFGNINCRISDMLFSQPNIKFVCNDEEFIIKKDGMFNDDTVKINQMIHENYIKYSRPEHQIALYKGPEFISFNSNTEGWTIPAIQFIK